MYRLKVVIDVVTYVPIYKSLIDILISYYRK